MRRKHASENNNAPQSSEVAEDNDGLAVVGGKEESCAVDEIVFDEIDGIGDGDDEG